MDCEIEKEIVNAFFEKRCRDRILFELKFEKKRQNFFDKIAHNCERYINCNLIKQKSQKPIDIEVIELTLCNKNSNCYVIAYKSDLDGVSTDFKTAMKELWANGSPYLIYSVDCNSLYLETEYDFSIHTSYILAK